MQRFICADLAGEVQAGVVHVRDQHARGSGGFGGLQGEQPDHASADDEHCFATDHRGHLYTMQRN